jgi:hypothetical protein
MGRSGEVKARRATVRHRTCPVHLEGCHFLARTERPSTAARAKPHGRTSPRATAKSAASAFVETSIFS